MSTFTRTFQLWLVFTVSVEFGWTNSLGRDFDNGNLALGPSSPPPLRSGSPQLNQNLSISLHLLDEPQDILVAKGQNATFRCLGKSDEGNLNITWYHNGQLILPNDGRYSIQSKGTVLLVSSVTEDGNYSCLVTNEAGSLKSSVAKLQIAYMDNDLSESDDQQVPESQLLSLRCSIHSFPPADIRWEFNQLPLPKDKRYVPLPNGFFIIRNTKRSDAGNYRCISTNPVLNQTQHSREVKIEISPPTSIESSPLIVMAESRSETVLIGEKVDFYCFMSGNPAPSVKWYKGDDILPNDNSSILTISNVKPIDSGQYKCTGVNSLGETNQKFYLNVFEKPSFVSTPMSVKSPAANTIRLNCSAKGIPNPKIVWYKNGVLLSIEGRIRLQGSELILAHSFTYDSGIYQCLAVNLVGEIWTSAEVKIDKSQNPDPPVNVKCRPFDEWTICLSWNSLGNQTLQAYSISSFYTDTKKSHSEKVQKANITYYEASDLYESTNYTFYVRSYTNMASDNSEFVTCQTGLTGSRNLTIAQRTPTSVLLKWDNVSTDIFCNGTKEVFKVSWRPVGDVLIQEETEDQEYVINGIMPGIDYEFRVSTRSNPRNGDWVLYSVPEALDDSNYTSQDVLKAPLSFKGEALSPTSVQLQWDSVTNARSYSVCYIPEIEKKNCQENSKVKSTLRRVVIDNLQPKTMYLFQVRAHDFENIPGLTSESIFIETPPAEPSKVLNLQYQMLNSSTACVEWLPPNDFDYDIKKYVVSYTPDLYRPLEKWIKLNVSLENNSLHCQQENLKSTDFLSVVLSNLTSGQEYVVVVAGVNKHGTGNGAMMNISQHANTVARENKSDMKINGGGVIQKSKLGVIIGILLALMLIAGCITFILVKRRCLKRHAFGRPRLATSRADYQHQPVAHYTTHLGAVQVKLDQPCMTEAHEIEHLVPDEGHGGSDRSDTEVRTDMPNGQINGRGRPNGQLPNECVRITENPQYMALEQNGDVVPSMDPNNCESDSNSNVKSSKFFDFHKLLEKTRRSSNSHHHSGQLGSSRRSSSCCSLNADSLNATQSTNLDESQASHSLLDKSKTSVQCQEGDAIDKLSSKGHQNFAETDSLRSLDDSYTTFRHKNLDESLLSHSCPDDSSKNFKLSHDLDDLYLNRSMQSRNRLSPILVPNG